MAPIHTYAVTRRAVPPSSCVVSTSSEEIVPFYLETMCNDLVFDRCMLHAIGWY